MKYIVSNLKISFSMVHIWYVSVRLSYIAVYRENILVFAFLVHIYGIYRFKCPFYRSIREDISGAKAAIRDTIPCPT